MYREIKFRAWDKVQNYMFIIFDGTSQNCWFLPNWKDKFDVMQYTGIKDKNGIEIYEGDIVQCTCGDCKCFRYVVNYQNGAFCLNDIEFPIGSWIMNFKHLKDLEVIGNIYENKELLENG